MQKRIASTYFADLECRRPLYGGYYKIPAVPKGEKPFVLVVDDKIQRSQEPSPEGSYRKVVSRTLIDGREIANDLMGEWTRNSLGMTPECRPGIWIVRDEVALIHDGSDGVHAAGLPVVDADGKAQWRPATEEEKATMWAEDLAAAKTENANWGDYLIQSGDVLAEDPKQWVLIGSLRRIAARYFGKDRPWLQELKDSDIKKCQWCTKTIPIQAVVCPNCQKVVNPVKAAELQLEQDEILAAMKAGPVRPPVVAPKPAARV